MTEGPDEAKARRLVEDYLGLALEYTDFLGSVDYRFTGPSGVSGALEVSRYTAESGRRAVAHWGAASAVPFRSNLLAKGWTVAVESDPDFRWLAARIEPALKVLASRGVRRFRIDDLQRAAFQDATLRPAVAVLRENGVTGGYEHQDPGPANIHLARVQGGSSRGSDLAVREIAEYVAATEDRRKLNETGATCFCGWTPRRPSARSALCRAAASMSSTPLGCRHKHRPCRRRSTGCRSVTSPPDVAGTGIAAGGTPWIRWRKPILDLYEVQRQSPCWSVREPQRRPR